MKRGWTVVVFILMALLPSCRTDKTPVGPVGIGQQNLEYTVAGGFAGGIHTRMSIGSGGDVILRNVDPPIQGTLTPEEQGALAQLSQEIWNQPDTLRGGCVDDFNFLIQWVDARGTKTISTDGCSLMGSRGAQYPVLTGLIQLLDGIASRVYQLDAPWRGIVASFTIDDSSYSLDDPITLTCTLRNPTSLTRSLFFPHAANFWFTVSQENVPGFSYSSPPSAWYPWTFPDSSPPSSVVLNPGEQKVLAFAWDHSVVNSAGVSGTLAVGTFHVQMGLLSGDFAVQNFVCDVYDKNIPIKGSIIPDYTDADPSSLTYTFQLRITNWTSSAMTLHFPNGQRIAVEVWDLNVDPPTTIIYATTILPPSTPETLTLAPHESVVLSETVNKVTMKPWYMWVLAKVRLLNTDFSFECDGQLQIFHQ